MQAFHLQIMKITRSEASTVLEINGVELKFEAQHGCLKHTLTIYAKPLSKACPFYALLRRKSAVGLENMAGLVKQTSPAAPHYDYTAPPGCCV